MTVSYSNITEIVDAMGRADPVTTKYGDTFVQKIILKDFGEVILWGDPTEIGTHDMEVGETWTFASMKTDSAKDVTSNTRKSKIYMVAGRPTKDMILRDLLEEVRAMSKRLEVVAHQIVKELERDD